MEDRKLPAWALWGLGATQVIGYGTLYYAFSVLVPNIAEDIGRSEQWVFGAFSVALFVAGIASPVAGHLTDKFGSGRLMAVGSILSALSLAALAFSTGPVTFAVALAVAEIVSTAVLYATAFTAIVQAGGRTAQKSIVHLTLIGGFASSLFWPLTSWLHAFLSWREVYLLFAALNLGVCFPVHFALGRLTSKAITETKAKAVTVGDRRPVIGGTLAFSLMLLGFAIEGYALSAILVHMVPLTEALGLGPAGLLVASLFGPAQVASRLINLVFGKELPQKWLAVIATVLLPTGLVILLVTTPWGPGAVLFAICFGLGSGLTSIVGGTLPLELFGKEGYGGRLGWCTSAKQFTSAIAPLAMSVSFGGLGVISSLWIAAAIGAAGTVAFVGIVFVTAAGPRKAVTASG